MPTTGDSAAPLGTPGRRTASRTLLLTVWGLLLTAVLAAGALQKAGEDGASSNAAQVARGKYLVMIGGCNDCHTPWRVGTRGPEPDMSHLLSGHPQDLVMPPAPRQPEGSWSWVGATTRTAFAGPWGVSYSSNLTPDPSTGLGIWTAEMFVQAMRTGRHMGQSRPIQPPMPWQAIGRMSDEDLRAIYGYLRSIPAIRNRPPETVLVEMTGAPLLRAAR